MATKPTIHYFSVRGRAEVMKLSLAAANVAFDVVPVDYAGMKTDREHYPFGQCPRYEDGGIDMVQSAAIIRFIGRKYKLDGSTEQERCLVDMIMEGVESIRQKYLNLIYQDKLETKDAYFTAHCDKSTASGRNGGAHFEYLAAILRKSATGFVAGGDITLADLGLFDIVDLHLRILEEKIGAEYPELVQHHKKIAALPGVHAYLESPLRVSQVNGNNLG